ncbi:MAG: molybdopterin-dependent oxidoreductase [Proteobacteria bacterium]|nr:molybdopterin-dependent oxidoreductase [Pseudomonadota bacterium]
MSTTIRTNCPRDCYDGCGIVVELRDNAQPRVLGDPTHPVSRGRLCSKCAIAYNGVWQDSSARLTHPMRRVGKKGRAAFERISWDEALHEIASKLHRIIDTQGPEAVLHTHYSGTLSLIAYQFPNRFFNYLGASEVDPDSICNAAGHVAWHLLYGNSVMGFDPRTIKDASCLLVWGANPSHSAPHAHEYWLTEASAKIVVIDPLQTDTAKAADLHLQLRPGSDAALAFGLLHVLQSMGVFDSEFIDSCTVGADEIMPTIKRCDPQWTSEQTGVPIESIIEAARLYAAGPAMLWCGQALQRQPSGGNIMRSVGLLPAMTGNVGKPGTGFCYLNYTPAFAGIDLDALAGAELRAQAGKKISHMDLAPRLVDANEIKALFSWNTNPLASAPRQKELRAAFERENLFTVVVDCFPTDTTAYADMVLPAASFLEFDDMTFSYFHLHMGAQAKVSEPMGESLPNQEIFRRLAKAMGYTQAELFEDDTALLNNMMSQMNPGFDFDGLKQRGHFYITTEPLPMHAERVFETPSGKIEIASNKAQAMGLPRIPQATVDARPRDGRLRLLSPASKWRLNDSYGNDPHIIEQSGPATVHVSPNDARTANVKDGDKVRLRNDTGAIELIARIDPSLLDGTALSYKGRWPSLESNACNLNFVHTARKADMGDSTSVHATEVILEPV